MITHNSRWALLIIGAILATSGLAFGADTYAIFGRVTGNLGQQMLGVSISVAGLPPALTDADGHYLVDGAATGSVYVVEPRRPGWVFTPERRAVVMGSGDEEVDFGARLILGLSADGRLAAAPPDGPVTKAYCADNYEPDDIASQANWLNIFLGQQHNITYADDDWMKFNLSYRSAVDVYTTDAAAPVLMYIYGPDDPTKYIGQHHGSDTAPNASISVPAPGLGPGVYYVRTQHWPGDLGVSCYAVNLDVSALPPGRVLYPATTGVEVRWQETIEVQWDRFYGSAVTIHLYKAGVYKQTIATATTNDGTYEWIVPYTAGAGDDYTIHVHSYAYPDQGDESTYPFKIKSSPVVTYPNESSIVGWNVGDVYTITWKGFTDTHVKIQLYKGSRLNRRIAWRTPNDGRFVWRVPEGQATGWSFYIHVTGANKPWQTDRSTHIFMMDNPKVTYPSAPDISWGQGSAHAVTWTRYYGNDIHIDLLKAGAVVRTIASDTSNDGSFVWKVPWTLEPGTTYRVRVRYGAQIDDSNNNFTVYAVPHVTYPSEAGITWLRESGYTIKWSGYSTPTVRIQLYRGARRVRTITTGTPNDGRFYWTVPAGQALGTDFKIRISEVGGAGGFDTSNNRFAIENP